MAIKLWETFVHWSFSTAVSCLVAFLCQCAFFPDTVCGVLTASPSLSWGGSQQSHLLLLGQIHEFTKLKADEDASMGQLH